MGLLNFIKNGQKKGSEDSIVFPVLDTPQHGLMPYMPRLYDSMEIMSRTINPDTFFSREKLASEDACERENDPHIVWNGMTCGQIYLLLNDKEKRDSFYMKFIDRLFEHGKEDRIAFQMHEVEYYLSDKCLDYYLKRLNGKKFHFCKVGFPESRKQYTYIAKDNSIKPGDSVTIPTGNEYVPDTKLKQVIDVYDVPLDALDFPIRYLRCIEEKLKNIICPHCGASIEINVGQKTGKCNHCQAEFYLV